MSAINPASFVTPAAGLGPIGMFGAPGIIGGRESPANRRRQLGFAGSHPSPGHTGQFTDSQNLQRGQNVNSQNMANSYFQPYQMIGAGIQQSGLGLSSYTQASQPTSDTYAAYMNPAYQQPLNPAAASYSAFGAPQTHGGRGNQHSPADWIGGFQGLSINNH